MRCSPLIRRMTPHPIRLIAQRRCVTDSGKRRGWAGVLGGLAMFVLLAPTAAAQLGGLPGINPGGRRMPGYDFQINDDNLRGPDLYTVKSAYKQGLRYLKKGKCKRAAERFDFVLEFLPKNSTAHYMAGSADRCEANYRSAAAHYREAIRYDEAMYLAYKNLGVSYLAQGQLQSALEPLAQLEVLRVGCETDCPEELETVYADLKKIVEMASLRTAPEAGGAD